MFSFLCGKLRFGNDGGSAERGGSDLSFPLGGGQAGSFLKCATALQAALRPAAAELLCHWLKIIQYLSTY